MSVGSLADAEPCEYFTQYVIRQGAARHGPQRILRQTQFLGDQFSAFARRFDGPSGDDMFQRFADGLHVTLAGAESPRRLGPRPSKEVKHGGPKRG